MSTTGGSGLADNWTRLALNGDKSGSFKISFLFSLPHHKADFKMSQIFTFGANWAKLETESDTLAAQDDSSRDVKFGVQISQNVLKLILKISQICPFGANLTQFRCQIGHPF